MDINLFNSKLFGRRYIIYEDDGKRKEYDILFGHIIYEGKYKNRKRVWIRW